FNVDRSCFPASLLLAACGVSGIRYEYFEITVTVVRHAFSRKGGILYATMDRKNAVADLCIRSAAEAADIVGVANSQRVLPPSMPQCTTTSPPLNNAQ
ncbi:hypothetical protein BHE74_00008318, partial [Ensete ventricosum]